MGVPTNVNGRLSRRGKNDPNSFSNDFALIVQFKYNTLEYKVH